MKFIGVLICALTDTFSTERDHLKSVLTSEQYRIAESTVLNAHYTDPALAAVMWDALRDAGFSGGRVLEPGCGAGTFIGLAPAAAQMVGVEKDPTTAAVAAHLYPSAQVRLEGFETTRVPAGAFAAVIGNVPFGGFSLHDPAHNPRGFSIHNHFIVKSLDLTAPGGYVAVITSRYTMDATDTKAREALAERAELVGAVRLPSNAFNRVAGTQVVTDVLVFRRREPGLTRDTAGLDWITTTDMHLSAKNGELVDLPVNDYFHAHPDSILGTPAVGHGLHGSTQLVIAPTHPDLPGAFAARLAVLVAAAKDNGLALTATEATLTDVDGVSFDAGLLTQANAGRETPLYSLRHNDATNTIQSWTGTDWADEVVPKTRLAETRQLLALRDAARAVIASQRDQLPPADREQLRGHLNRLYDTYVAKHGPVNRYKWTNPTAVTKQRHDKKLGKYEQNWRKEQDGYTGSVPAELYAEWDEKAWRPATPVKLRNHLRGAIRRDPDFATVAALESFNEDSQIARKALIFSVDLLGPPTIIDHADTIGDALAVCLEQRRRVDIDRIAELLGEPESVVRAQLRGLVYPSLSNPDELIPANVALSGNVRDKLARARTAAQDDPAYLDYVTALHAVMPADKTPAEITPRLGAPWIDGQYLAQFASEVLGAYRVVVDYHDGRWGIDAGGRSSVLMKETFGTPRRDAITLLAALCNNENIVVERTKADREMTAGPRVDQKGTVEAQAKASKIADKFRKWIFADEARRDTLVAEYNRRFNSHVTARHNGDALTLPGLSDRFTPHPHQRDAVARILAEPAVLLDHVVGAGKSGTMFMGAMEMKRLGLAKQPWIVVPNHIIEQVGREAKWWYPGANILLGEAATDAEGRARLVAQSAANDWDMVIVPESLFTAIQVSPATQSNYALKQISELKETLERRSGGQQTTATKKRIEAALQRLTTKLAKLTDQATKDDGLSWEMVGCDYLFVDEAHHYKNLTRVTHIEELSCPKGSTRAEDLAMKLDQLRERRRHDAIAEGSTPTDAVGRVATFATGTPVANSIGELYVMQKYLRPDLLQDAGVDQINAWANAFTTTTRTVEVGVTGTGLKPVQRIGKFTNVPELLSMTSVYTDVVTRDDLIANAPVALPEMVAGRRQIIAMTPSQEVQDFIQDLGYRAGQLTRDTLHLDNILKISTDGRNVSLDPRLAGLDAPEQTRASRVADEIARIHAATAENIYKDPETQVAMEQRGGLQIVFCDRGTPKKHSDQFNMYDAIRDELTARGIDPTKIAYIHDADKPEDKLALFAKCNTGEISVLLCSTEKAGTGVNVQTRAVALHHVDVPWRPADLEQREGRIMRQGNQNRQIEILNYVTEATYDTVMWQKVEAKALFIEQIKRGRFDGTEIEDIGGGEMTLAAAETKALATGDPRHIRQVELSETVQRLDALERAHFEAQARRERELKQANRTLAQATSDIATLDPLVADITKRAKSPAHTTVGERQYAERKDAAGPFAAACRGAYDSLRDRPGWETRPIATINGLQLVGHRDNLNGKLVLSYEVPSAESSIDAATLHAATSPTLDGADSGAKARGMLQRAENLYNDIPAHHIRLHTWAKQQQATVDDFTATALAPFEHGDELRDSRAELQSVTVELQMEQQSETYLRAQAEARERLAAAGHMSGWSLELNPTPTKYDELGMDKETYVEAYKLSAARRAKTYREEQRNQHRDKDTDRANGGDELAV